MIRLRYIALIALLCIGVTSITSTASPGIKDLFKKKNEIATSVHPDLPSLTVDENLLIPELDKKQKIQARKIQKLEADRLSETEGIEVELLRDEEVIHVTIAASRLFAPNQTALLGSADPLLRAILPCMRVPDYYHILLVMHSDDTGNEEYNYNLTTERVSTIYDWFDNFGECVDFVVPYAAGSAEPIHPNNTIAGRHANRRLEIFIIPAEAMFKK